MHFDKSFSVPTVLRFSASVNSFLRKIHHETSVSEGNFFDTLG